MCSSEDSDASTSSSSGSSSSSSSSPSSSPSREDKVKQKKEDAKPETVSILASLLNGKGIEIYFIKKKLCCRSLKTFSLSLPPPPTRIGSSKKLARRPPAAAIQMTTAKSDGKKKTNDVKEDDSDSDNGDVVVAGDDEGDSEAKRASKKKSRSGKSNASDDEIRGATSKKRKKDGSSESKVEKKVTKLDKKTKKHKKRPVSSDEEVDAKEDGHSKKKKKKSHEKSKDKKKESTKHKTGASSKSREKPKKTSHRIRKPTVKDEKHEQAATAATGSSSYDPPTTQEEYGEGLDEAVMEVQKIVEDADSTIVEAFEELTESQGEGWLLYHMAKYAAATKKNSNDEMTKHVKELLLFNPNLCSKWFVAITRAALTRTCIVCEGRLENLTTLADTNKPAHSSILCPNCCSSQLVAEARLKHILGTEKIPVKGCCIKHYNKTGANTYYLRFIYVENDNKGGKADCGTESYTQATVSDRVENPGPTLLKVLKRMAESGDDILSYSQKSSENGDLDYLKKDKENFPVWCEEFVKRLPVEICSGLLQVVEATGKFGQKSVLKLFISYAQKRSRQYVADHSLVVGVLATAHLMVLRLEVVSKVLRELNRYSLTPVLLDCMKGVSAPRSRVCKEIRDFVLCAGKHPMVDLEKITKNEIDQTLSGAPTSTTTATTTTATTTDPSSTTTTTTTTTAADKQPAYRRPYSTSGINLHKVDIPTTSIKLVSIEEQLTREVKTILSPVAKQMDTITENLTHLLEAQAAVERIGVTPTAVLRNWMNPETYKQQKEKLGSIGTLSGIFIEDTRATLQEVDAMKSHFNKTRFRPTDHYEFPDECECENDNE